MRRAKAELRVSRVHRRTARQRNDFLHKTTTALVARHDLVCIEDLSVKGLAKTKLGKSILDAAFGEVPPPSCIQSGLERETRIGNRTILPVE